MNRSEEEILNAWNLEEAYKYIVHDVFLIIYFIVGVFGNVVVLIVYQVKLKKESDSRYFIPILALVDLLATILRVPFELWRTILPVNFRDINACRYLWFVVNIFTFASIYFLGIITLQRYLKVCRPFGPQLTLRWRRASLVFIFLLAAGTGAPFVIWDEILPIPNSALNVTGYICGADVFEVNENSDYILGFIFFISFVITSVMLELIILNSLIARKIYTIIRNTNARRNSTKPARSNASKEISGSTFYVTQDGTSITEANSTDFSLTNNEQEIRKEKLVVPLSNYSKPIKSTSENQEPASSRKFSYMFMVISLAFILSYLPQIFLLFSLINDRYFWIKISQTETIVFKFIDHMTTVNNIVNPYVYGFFDQKFRASAKTLC
ncbi:orexin receptor type 2-like [Mytilus galloprovincialis]|uniref:orexin receptor type 2-like n=1 Tax=Mytilus galloprovincialis TaxID=29158 RepID=UPI003F7B6F7C